MNQNDKNLKIRVKNEKKKTKKKRNKLLCN